MGALLARTRKGESLAFLVELTGTLQPHGPML
jgi:hypothetical protein